MTAHVTHLGDYAGAGFSKFGGWLNKVVLFISNHSEAMRCSREAERLFRMNDDQLARLGLTRDRIVHHAFARYLGL